MMDEIDLSKLLALAARAAERASFVLSEHVAGLKAVDEARGKDIKLEADRLADAGILAVLREQPYVVLSEESGETRKSSDSVGYRWIVDPLDGTYNFYRGMPMSCVSIGFWRGDEPLLGLIHDFNRGETFSGIVGDGAWLNGVPIRVSSEASAESGVLFTGFPVYADYTDESLAAMVGRVRKFKKIRAIGSAALSLAYLAAGRGEAYREDNIAIWDVAAGLALVRAAGGSISMTATDRRDIFLIEASNGKMRDI